MIVTVTMNPAIDKTVRLSSFEHGGLNRIKDVTLDASGKGINVSLAIKELGGESVACGFLGGNNGFMIAHAMEEEGVNCDFVEIEQEIRINTKIAEEDGTVTELNEAGPNVSKEKQEELIRKLMRYATNDTWFVLSGSVPPGVPKTIYRDIIEKVHEKGAKVFLDADGELFTHAIEANPDIIKPNRDELRRFMGCSEDLSEEQMLQVGEQFLVQGIGTVIISLGQDGAMFLTREQKIKCPAILVKVRSTVGAGDAMVAAFVYATHKGTSFEDCVRLSIASSAAAVELYGTRPAEKARVDALKQEVAVINC